jgi:hypothetical protein
VTEHQIKAAVRARDGFRCRLCGMGADEHASRFGRGLEVHRIIPGSDYTLDGCMTLCRPCHDLQPRSPRGFVQARRLELGLPFRFTVRIDAALVRAARAYAKDEMRTLRATVTLALRKFLAEQSADAG